MCGIVGICLSDQAVTREQVAAMNQTLFHRGPDGDGFRVERNVGIGMRRLSIIDLDGGWQPISNENDEIHVVQNGEIYNYRELREELRAHGHRFRTESDTEVIVHAFEQWGGLEFASRLRGMFALAVWDRGKRELWVARDRLGIKPLFYSRNRLGFAFASEVKALLASPIVEREMDLTALADYLTYGSADIAHSFVKNVCQLEPGCVLRVDTESGESELRRYWEFRFPEARLELDESTAEEALYEKLRETVRLHLASDVPLGAFLSGGVDSSAVVGIMVQEGVADLKTFSIGFSEEEFNELPYAREIARKWGCDHHEQILAPDAMRVMEQIGSHLDEPFADASAIPTWYVSQLAASEVKVVLTGDGGDELFAGYDRFATAESRLYLDRIPAVLRRLGARLSRTLPSAFPGAYFLDYAGLDAAGRYAAEHCLFPLRVQDRLLLPAFKPETLGFEHPLTRAADALRGFDAGDYVSDCMHFDTIRYLPMDILTKVDRMAMAHSLEARPPILDHEFLEFAASLPTSFKYRSASSRKYIFRKAVERVVPRHLMERKKAGFAVPLQAWFSGPLRSMFEDAVLQNGLTTQYLDRATIRVLFEENRRGRRDHGLRLWALLMLELWLRRLPEKHPLEG